MPNFKVGDKIMMLEDCYPGAKKGDILTVKSGKELHVGEGDGNYCSCQYKWQLIEPSMKTWETLMEGDEVEVNSDYKTVRTVLGIKQDVIALSSPYDRMSFGMLCAVEEARRWFTIIQDTPETVEIDGKKYLKSAVIERLEELDPIE